MQLCKLKACQFCYKSHDNLETCLHAADVRNSLLMLFFFQYFESFRSGLYDMIQYLLFLCLIVLGNNKAMKKVNPKSDFQVEAAAIE